MERPDHNNVDFFYGTEVEHSPAYGMHTLFVVGVQEPSYINDALSRASHDTNHLYFGANQSFPMEEMHADGWRPWVDMIQTYLAQDYFCTLDLDSRHVPDLMETLLVEKNRFIPMISVKLPFIDQLGYNATLKLDDTNFDYSNPGVWCHTVHSLKDREVFTDWSKYTQDVVIKPTDE